MTQSTDFISYFDVTTEDFSTVSDDDEGIIRNDSELPLMNAATTSVGFLICLLLLLIGVFGNTLLLASISRIKALRTINNIFIASLALNSNLFLLGFCPVVLHVYLKKNRVWDIGRFECLLLRWFVISFLPASCTCDILCITIQRYLIIVRPLIYSKINSKIKLLSLVITIHTLLFLMSFFGELLPGVLNGGEVYFDAQFMYCVKVYLNNTSNYRIVIYFVVVLSIIALIYWRIYVAVKSCESSVVCYTTSVSETSRRNVDKQPSKENSIEERVSTSQFSLHGSSQLAVDANRLNQVSPIIQYSCHVKSTSSKKREAAVAKVSLIILSIYILLYIPWPVGFNMYVTKGQINEWASMLIIMSYTSSFCVPSIVYGLMNPTFSKAFKKILSDFFCSN